ncbi:hypothetical protein H4582DRAFT_582339 [Lactarius indigo]|nr:hypothetical protein H4582DRAFT_582339 [Lactarius indigo]
MKGTERATDPPDGRTCFHQLPLPPFFARIQSNCSHVSPLALALCTRSRRILIVVVACPGWPNPRLEVPTSSSRSASGPPYLGGPQKKKKKQYSGEAIYSCATWKCNFEELPISLRLPWARSPRFYMYLPVRITTRGYWNSLSVYVVGDDNGNVTWRASLVYSRSSDTWSSTVPKGQARRGIDVLPQFFFLQQKTCGAETGDFFQTSNRKYVFSCLLWTKVVSYASNKNNEINRICFWV